jgi:hypothetical protein
MQLKRYSIDDDLTGDQMAHLDPRSGYYHPGARPTELCRLASGDRRLVALRNIAEHGELHAESHLVELPSHHLGTLISYPTAQPIVWALWLPDDWCDELAHLKRARLEVANLAAVGMRNATTSFLLVGRTGYIGGDTNCPPRIRSRGAAANPLVMVFLCCGIAHVVHYMLAQTSALRHCRENWI